MGAVCEKRAAAGPMKAAAGDLQDDARTQVKEIFNAADKELSGGVPDPWPVFCGLPHLDTHDKMSAVAAQAEPGCHAVGEDEDEDGDMDQAKFVERLSDFAAGLSEEQKGEHMKMADQDGDGRVPADELRSFISKLDRNGDGKLSAEDLGVKGAGTVAAALVRPLVRDLTAMAPRNVRPCFTVLVDMSFAYITGGAVLEAGLKSALKISQRLVISAVTRGFTSSVWRRPMQQPAESRATAPVPEQECSAGEKGCHAFGEDEDKDGSLGQAKFYERLSQFYRSQRRTEKREPLIWELVD